MGPTVFLPLHSSNNLYGICVVLAVDAESMVDLTASLRHLAPAISLSWMIGNHRTSTPRAHRDQEKLTPRQLQVLHGMSNGETNTRIALSLGFSASTIRHETMRIYRFLGVDDRRTAVAVAEKLELIPGAESVPDFHDRSQQGQARKSSGFPD
jgi:DNA-binding NarL/FixJ family response regulator